MKKDIYGLLNNGEFNEEKYKNINKEEFDDFTIKKIERYVKKNSKGRKKNNKVKVVAVAVACVFIIGLCNTSIGTEVLASVSNILSKIDPNKNYKSDYVVEPGKSNSKNGVEIKIDECYRSMGQLRIVYTMNFEKGVPDSVKAKEELRSTLEPVKGHSYEYVAYENNGIVDGNKITINDWVISDTAHTNNEKYKYGIWNYESRDIEIGEKSIKKEVIFYIEDLTIKDDLNIKIEYDNIVNNSGEEIKGPWTIDYKANAEPDIKDIEKNKLDRDYGYKFKEGEVVSIDSYANTNTGIKIFSTITGAANIPIIRLQGVDNLGNEIIMYPIHLNYKEYDAHELVFTLYDGQTGNRETLKQGVTSLKLKLYADNPESIEDDFKPVGDEFTINIQ